MRTFRRFAVVALGLLAVWLAYTYADTRYGEGGAFLNYLYFVVLPVAFLGFMWSSWPLFHSYRVAYQLLGRTVVSLAATAIWFLPAIYLVLQFYMLIGGRL